MRGENVASQAVIFDMDGLMVDTEPLARRAWQAVVAAYGHTLDQPTLNSVLGLRLMDTSRVMKERFDLPLSVDEIAAWRVDAFLQLVDGNLIAMPGLYRLLDAVEMAGVPHAVATSSPSLYAPAVLREIGVAERFQVVVTGDMVARGKPAPDIYLAAAERLGFPATACLALEDSPNGVRAAKAAGLCCIAVPNEMTAGLDLDGADAVFESLDTVVDHLDEWLDGLQPAS
jgi:HAD superfamily hydrolase (TIGR01509 family)